MELKWMGYKFWDDFMFFVLFQNLRLLSWSVLNNNSKIYSRREDSFSFYYSLFFLIQLNFYYYYFLTWYWLIVSQTMNNKNVIKIKSDLMVIRTIKFPWFQKSIWGNRSSFITIFIRVLVKCFGWGQYRLLKISLKICGASSFYKVLF